MQCQECLSRLSEYLDQKMDSQIDPSLHEHLEDCSTCQEEFRLLERTVQLIRELPPLAVPLDLRASIQNKIQKEKNRRWQWYKASTFGLAVAAGVLLLFVILPRFSRLNLSSPESSVSSTESPAFEEKENSSVVAEMTKAKKSPSKKYLSKKMEKRRQGSEILEERKDQFFRDKPPVSFQSSFDANAGEDLAEEDSMLDIARAEESTVAMQEVIMEEELSDDDYLEKEAEKEIEETSQKTADESFLARNEDRDNLGRRLPGENIRALLESGKENQDTFADKKESAKTLAKNNPTSENKDARPGLTRETSSRLKQILQSVFNKTEINEETKEKAGKPASPSSISSKKEFYYQVEYQKGKKNEQESDIICTIVASDFAQAQEWIAKALPSEKTFSKKEKEEKLAPKIVVKKNEQKKPLENSGYTVNSPLVWKKHLQEHQWQNFISAMKAKKGIPVIDVSKSAKKDSSNKWLNVKIILIEKNIDLLKENNTKKE